jgi:hypothetical protein
MWGCPKTQLGSDETRRTTENFRETKLAEFSLKATAELYWGFNMQQSISG